MKLFVTGINHRTVSLASREKYALPPQDIQVLLSQICSCPPIDEVVLLSTCNRLEVYALSSKQTLPPRELFGHVLRMAWPDMPQQDFLELQNGAYLYEADACVAHLFRVTSSLDSLVMGETEVVGQVKRAYQASLTAQATGKYLNRLFQKALAVSKRVRTESRIGNGSVSLGSVAVDLASEYFGESMEVRPILLAGTGEMGQSVLRRLTQRVKGPIWITNRSEGKTYDLASRFGVQAVAVEQMQEILLKVDMLVASASSREPLFTREDLAMAMERRKGRPLLIIDLGVPRNVDPSVGSLEGVCLANIDDLGRVAQQNLHRRREEALLGEKLALEAAQRFMNRLRLDREQTPCLSLIEEPGGDSVYLNNTFP